MTDASTALAEHLAAQDKEQADALGIDPTFVRAGRELDSDPEELAALDGCRTQAEVVSALEGLDARRKARAEAKEQALVAEEAKRL